MKSPAERAEALIEHWHKLTPMLQIGGTGVESDARATIEVCSPADGRPIGRCPAGNATDVDRAVKAAQRASDEGWRDLPPGERGNLLWRFAEIIEQYANDLAIMESLQTGKTFREALTRDVAMSIATLKYYAGWCNKRGGEVMDLGGGFFGMTHQEPLRVVGAVLTWTFPLTSAVWKAAPALAAGSTVVLKPSELTPMTAQRLAELATKVGLPPGVINVVTGTGPQAGEALALHSGVDALGFSGSIEAARHVLVSAAKSNLKPVHLTLGGKGANIVFDDADLRRAASAAWKAIFTARGQVSTAGSRLLVHESRYDELVAIVTDRAREIVVGDPLDEHTEMGPVISEAQMKKALSYVELGRREGARLVAGGMRDVDGSKPAGYFIKPTVFMDVKPSMRIAREEILGPVLCIIPFSTEEEAIEIANATDYGMANAVWTKDLGRAHRVARALRCGTVWINQYDHFDPSLPFGGVGLSGLGRDLGRQGLDAASRTKAVYLSSH